ncbi:DUF924 domain-containing protein [Jejubacter calystegiae]|uniref:DUF924 domain-containing protein n=1 Tax=Jejubacter calystegiae TaxID=2579935 RepID=A0A4P8YK07_9ENTR|nr:DUF924 family protein [Jejubacter calystegiae]QCT20433.1 DUF924 domain-containing protein [Jejubacter calystegiae]
MDYREILHFWFSELKPGQWFRQSNRTDTRIRTRFFDVWQAATRGELAGWRGNISGRLAEILVLDQFSRNLWRRDARAFTQDGMALVLAQEALRQPDFGALGRVRRNFILMPFMHAESAVIQAQALRLFDIPGNEQTLRTARQHHFLIAQFGRYPHRNAVLGRDSTPGELDFMARESFAFMKRPSG